MSTFNVYWNEDYCGANIEFETFKKSKYIASALNDYGSSQQEYDKLIVVKNPADRVGMLAKAQLALQEGLEPEYLQAVMTGRPRSLAESNGFDWDAGVYHMVLNSTAGIFCAIQDAKKSLFDFGCSLSSGLHHARRSYGLGFCTVNSLALGAIYAREIFDKVLILDLDAHCGGGTNEYLKGTDIMQVDYSTSNFDSYEPDSLRQLIFCENSEDYLDVGLPKVLDAVEKANPTLVLYNAGVDIYPFVKPEIVVKRELMVADYLKNLGTKVVIVMAGGYGDYETITQLHLSTLMAFASNGNQEFSSEMQRIASGHPLAGQFLPA